MMTKKLAVLALAATLAACGGGESPTAPTPTPTPAPSYSGTYSGAMTYTGGGFNAFPITGTVTVTQQGAQLTLSSLSTSLGPSYGLGTATLVSEAFDGVSSYASTGCGVVISRYRGRFAGRLLNLTVTLTPASCGAIDIRGEISR